LYSIVLALPSSCSWRSYPTNLLLTSRFKDEIGAGLKAGIIRAMTSTGGVVTAAGLVFAATMSATAAAGQVRADPGRETETGVTRSMARRVPKKLLKNVSAVRGVAALTREWPSRGREHTYTGEIMKDTTKLTLALRAHSIRNLTAAELRIANGGCTCADTRGTRPLNTTKG
jgi:hypothetical protein